MYQVYLGRIPRGEIRLKLIDPLELVDPLAGAGTGRIRLRQMDRVRVQPGFGGYERGNVPSNFFLKKNAGACQPQEAGGYPQPKEPAAPAE